MRLGDAADLYLAGLSCVGTERQYRRILGAFARLCEGAGRCDLEAVTVADVMAFKASQAHLAPATLTHRLAVVRSFLNTAESVGWIPRSPAAHLKLSRPRQHRPSSLTVDQQQALVAAAQSPRDRVLVTLLMATGCRVGEVCAARVSDFDGGQLRLVGKGGRERFVPLARDVAALVASHVSGRAPDALLIGGRQRGLGTRQAQNVFHACCRRAALAERGPHQARHAAAMRWHVVGRVPLVVISALLGHARVSTTADMYLHASQELMRAAIAGDQLWSAPPAA